MYTSRMYVCMYIYIHIYIYITARYDISNKSYIHIYIYIQNIFRIYSYMICDLVRRIGHHYNIEIVQQQLLFSAAKSV